MLLYEKDLSKYIADCFIAVCNAFSCTATKYIKDKKNLEVYTYYFDVQCREDRYKKVLFLASELQECFYICSDRVIISNANLKLSNRLCWLREDKNIESYLRLLESLQLVNPSIERFKKL